MAVAVAAPNPSSAAAGDVVARLGGNAVDAAVAAMFAALVSEPGISSFGGGGFVTVASAGQEPVTIDGSVAMPGLGRAADAVTADLVHLFLEYGGGSPMQVGPASVAVPGTLPALELAQRRFGGLPWEQVVAPSAELARSGFPMGSAAAHYLGFSGVPLFGRDPAAAAVLTRPDGVAFGLGDLIRMPELADFLERVATEGADALMTGETAAALVELMAEQGGLITAHDLARYRPVVRPALQMRCAGWTFGTNPGPAVGGPVLAAMLALLDPGKDERISLERLVGVQREVLAYRAHVLDVAPDRAVAALDLLATIDAGPGVHHGGSAPSTVHVSAVDGDGQACAITASAGYGAGLSIPGTGVWLNNCIGEPELNRRPAAAGERLVSNMTPTVGRHDDGRVLAIGSPGSDRITTAILQTLLGLIAGDTLTEAVARPRAHVGVAEDGGPLRVEAETDLPGRDGVATDLPWREHPPLSMFFGGVGAALREPGGDLQAAADPRRDGAVTLT